MLRCTESDGVRFVCCPLPQDEKSERLKQLNKELVAVAAKPHKFWDTQPVPKLGALLFVLLCSDILTRFLCL